MKRQEQGAVAFHAVCSNAHVTGIDLNDNIVFEDVKLNLGDSYHASHGLFIAPVPGVYLFSASVTSSNTENQLVIDAAIVKNGEELARLKGRGDLNPRATEGQGSVTVAMVLNRNDEVWVKNIWPDDATIQGGGFSSFTGVLVSHSQ